MALKNEAVTKLSEQLKTEQAQIATTASLISERSAELRTARAELAENRDASDSTAISHKTHVSQQDEMLANFSAKISAQNQEISSRKSLEHELRTNQDSLRNALDLAIAEKNEILARASPQPASTTSAVDEKIRIEIKQIRTERESLVKDLRAAEQALSDKTSDVERAEATAQIRHDTVVATLRTEVDEYKIRTSIAPSPESCPKCPIKDRTILELRTQRDTVNQELTESRNQQSVLADRLANSDRERTEAMSALNTCKIESAKLTVDCNGLQKHMGIISSKRDEAESALRTTKTDLESANAKILKIESENTKLAKRTPNNDALKANISELEAINAKLIEADSSNSVPGTAADVALQVKVAVAEQRASDNDKRNAERTAELKSQHEKRISDLTPQNDKRNAERISDLKSQYDDRISDLKE